MKRYAGLAVLCLGLAPVGLVGQTTVTTTGGSTNTVPLFTGTSTLGNSAITQSNGFVGIGTSAPLSPLSVSGQLVIGSPYKGDASFTIDASYGCCGRLTQITPAGASQSALNIMGSTDSNSSAQWFAWGVNAGNWTINPGTGFTSPAAFMITSAGNVGIGATAPDKPLYVNGGIHLNMPGGINWSNNQSLLITNAVDTAAGDTGAQIWHGDGGSGGSHLLIFSSYPQTSFPLTGGYMVLNTVSGNVGIGTTTPQAKLEVNGNLHFTGDAAGVYQTTAWTGVLCGGDYAEAVRTKNELKNYGPGDVLVITSDGNGDVEKASEAYSTMVAGIYATKPGVIGRRQNLGKDTDDLPMAMVGIVPAKVSTENGPIHRGDLLVTASTPGYAMKGVDRSRLVGAVIGKAMGSLDSGEGVIEVLVTLQ